MEDIKCEICGGDGMFKTKDGSTKKMIASVPPYPKNIDLRKSISFHWRCVKCMYKNQTQ